MHFGQIAPPANGKRLPLVCQCYGLPAWGPIGVSGCRGTGRGTAVFLTLKTQAASGLH